MAIKIFYVWMSLVSHRADPEWALVRKSKARQLNAFFFQQSKGLLQLIWCSLLTYSCPDEGESDTAWNVIVTQNVKHCPQILQLMTLLKPINWLIPFPPAFLCGVKQKQLFFVHFMKSAKCPDGWKMYLQFIDQVIKYFKPYKQTNKPKWLI